MSSLVVRFRVHPNVSSTRQRVSALGLTQNLFSNRKRRIQNSRTTDTSLLTLRTTLLALARWGLSHLTIKFSTGSENASLPVTDSWKSSLSKLFPEKSEVKVPALACRGDTGLAAKFSSPKILFKSSTTNRLLRNVYTSCNVFFFPLY